MFTFYLHNVLIDWRCRWRVGQKISYWRIFFLVNIHSSAAACCNIKREKVRRKKIVPNKLLNVNSVNVYFTASVYFTILSKNRSNFQDLYDTSIYTYFSFFFVAIKIGRIFLFIFLSMQIFPNDIRYVVFPFQLMFSFSFLSFFGLYFCHIFCHIFAGVMSLLRFFVHTIFATLSTIIKINSANLFHNITTNATVENIICTANALFHFSFL